MKINYLELCHNFGLKVPTNDKLWGDPLRNWQEIQAMRTILPIVAQSYIGCFQVYGISADTAIAQFKRTLETNTRKKAIHFIDVTADIVSSLVGNDRKPQSTGLAVLGLLKIIPVENFGQADQRFVLIKKYLLPDPVASEVYHKNPRVFYYEDNEDSSNSLLQRDFCSDNTPIGRLINLWRINR